MAQDQLYYPWGQDWNMVGTAEEKRFASLQHRDSTETGLDPTQFRMLSSTRGRWYSADPVYGRSHNPQSLNRYAYVVNGPSNRIDPFGNQYCDPYSGCGYCDPFDPFSFCAEPVFSGTIRINFFCPDNTCSCCPYYDRLILWGPSFLDRWYGRRAKFVCERAGSGCARNCVRECLVEFNIQNCDHLPSAKDRFVCREITGHAVCVPTCIVVGGFLDKGITIRINYPIYIQTTVVVPFSCSL